jgi:type IV pilus assembly protein PilW
MNKRTSQSGFTLVEILIALLLGLFLTAGMIEMTQHNKTTYSNQTALAQLQDSERFALSVLNDTIQQAGYYPDPTIRSAPIAMPAGLLPQFVSPAQPLWGNTTSISVQYALGANDAVLNCDGSQSAVKATYINTLTVVPDPITPMNGKLTCTVTTAGGARPPVTLITGVTAMDIRYGINNTGSTTNHDINMYKTAAQMLASDWLNVTAVQVSLTFANPMLGQPGQAAKPTFTIIKTIGVMTRVGVTS